MDWPNILVKHTVIIIVQIQQPTGCGEELVDTGPAQLNLTLATTFDEWM